MKKFTPYLFLILALGIASCTTGKKENNANTTAQASVKEDDLRIISQQSEPDTLKGSLSAKAIGSIGPLNVTINYHSPAVRGRVIWGGLVAFDNVWVTGAHSATSIEFDRKVKIGEITIAPGKYALFTIPGKEEWTIILNKNWKQHLADDYLQADDIVRIMFKPENEAHQERLRFVIEAETNSSGEIVMYWDKLEISLPIEVVN